MIVAAVRVSTVGRSRSPASLRAAPGSLCASGMRWKYTRIGVSANRAQIEGHRDPRDAVNDQLDSEEQADHPESRNRPLRQYENAEHQCDEAVQRVPAPVWQGHNKRSDQLEQTGDQEERANQQRNNLGGDHRPPHDQRSENSEQNRM